MAIPMIMAGPDVPQGKCATPVSLLDLSQTIAAQFGAEIDGADGLRPLPEIAAARDDPERPVFSEYHAIGAVSGAYMLRKGRWKLNHYVGFAPELFDLENDPEELTDIGTDPAYGDVLAEMTAALRQIGRSGGDERSGLCGSGRPCRACGGQRSGVAAGPQVRHAAAVALK